MTSPPDDPRQVDPNQVDPPAPTPSLGAYADQLIELAMSQKKPLRPVSPRPPDQDAGEAPFEPQAFSAPDPSAHSRPVSEGDPAMSESSNLPPAMAPAGPPVEPTPPHPAAEPAAAAPATAAAPAAATPAAAAPAAAPTAPSHPAAAAAAQGAPAAAQARTSETTAQLQAAVNELSTLGKILNLKMLIGLGAVGALMLMALGVFAGIGLKLSGRITQMDASVFAVGKRVVELEAGLQNLAALSQQVGVVAKRQEELMRAQGELKAQMDGALRQSATLVSQVPQQAAKELAATQEGLSKQVRSLDGRLQLQAGAVTALGREVQNLQQSVASVPALRKDIETLVTLQRERYLEQLQKQSEVTRKPPPPAPRPPALPQYPRPGPSEPTGTPPRD